MSPTIIIGGDFVPTANNKELFDRVAIKELVGEEILDLLSSANYRIFNCESPLTNYGNPIEKCGPNLKSDPSSADVFKELGIDFMTLANNHILDYGEIGLNETVRHLKDRGIAYSGVGRNRKEASEPYILNLNDLTVGVFCCAEHEFSVATDEIAGACHFDPLYSLETIESLKERCDNVIVLYHGGRELYQYPTPRQQEVCRRIIECGADLVVCQHSHCVGCLEEYSSGTIVYGQGNFLFDRNDNPLTKDGLLLQVELSAGSFKVLPIAIRVENGVVRLSNGREKERIIKSFNERSNNVRSANFVKEEFDKLCRTISNYCLVYFHGSGLFERTLNKLFFRKLISACYSKKKLLRLLNMVICETHKEVTARSLEIETLKK